MNADTHSASEESVNVIQGCVAHGTLYVRLTCPTMDNRHNKLSQVPEFLPKGTLDLIYLRFRHFRNKVKSVNRAFLVFPCPQAWWILNKPSGCAFGLANDSTKPPRHGKTGMPCSLDFIFIIIEGLKYISSESNMIIHKLPVPNITPQFIRTMVISFSSVIKIVVI